MSEPIEQLLRERLAEESLRELARRAGGVISYRTLHKIAVGDFVAFPAVDTIRVLAGLLGISERDCVLAFAASLGLDRKAPPG